MFFAKILTMIYSECVQLCHVGTSSHCVYKDIVQMVYIFHLTMKCFVDSDIHQYNHPYTQTLHHQMHTLTHMKVHTP